jgi:sugar phosphate permease
MVISRVWVFLLAKVYWHIGSSRRNLATKQSIWNASHSIGAGLVSVLCGFLLKHFGYSAWQLCFAVPAIIAILGAAVIWFGVKDNPSSVGLPDIEDIEREENGGAVAAPKEEDDAAKGAAFKKIANKLVFGNPLIWILAVSNFCIYVIRFTILDWGTSILTQFKGLDIATAGTAVGLAEMVGGILGMLVAGWATDRYLKSKAHRACFICTVCATITFVCLWKSTSVWAVIMFDILTSFFIYGPQALLGTCASMQATKHAAATANGILGIFGYASTTVSGVLFGIIKPELWLGQSILGRNYLRNRRFHCHRPYVECSCRWLCQGQQIAC